MAGLLENKTAAEPTKTEEVRVPINRRTEQTEISKHSSDLSKRIREELACLAEARQTSISKETYDIYSRALIKFDVRDVLSAIRALAIAPRSDFQTAFPALGDIVERTKQAQKQRRSSMRKPCGLCVDGWVVNRRSPNPISPCQCKLEYEAFKKEVGI